MPMRATIAATEYYLPDTVLDNDRVTKGHAEWTPDKIYEKTGIRERHIASANECASDLAVLACEKLFASGRCKPADIDFILLCTQTPDYFLPTTACLIQDRLGIPASAGALDFNLGCSGFIFGLGLAKGLIETEQARNVLLVTAETYSKFINEGDVGTRSLFGDAAAATLVLAVEGIADADFIGPFVYGTDGSGAQNLIVPSGGMRKRTTSGELRTDKFGNTRTDQDLYMDGAEIFTFALRAVPKAVEQLLKKAQRSIADVDLFVFHQANKFMLDHLRRKMNIAEQRFVIALGGFGNTVSSTIPIALKEAENTGRLHTNDNVMLVGFGVGYSWGATFVRWRGGIR